MKKVVFISLFACIVSGVSAQELKLLSLDRPRTEKGMPIMKALEKRQSVREFSKKPLSRQELSDLLWAANGVNRPESGKRTAPSAMNVQEIEVYVCLPEGTYLYDAKAHVLRPVAKGDFRSMVGGGQQFVTEAPVCVVLVADMERYKNGNAERNLLMAAMDAGIVSQNISLFCSGTGLVTVPRASMDQAGLRKVLNLKDTQQLMMNHPVGYAK